MNECMPINVYDGGTGEE